MDARRGAAVSAGVALIGALTSGPLGVAVLAVLDPQPAWTDAATWADAYHDIQVLPYACGYLLVSGFLFLLGFLHQLAPEDRKGRSTVALAFAAVFGAMIFTNYALQTTAVPWLLKGGQRDGIAFAAQLTMANPRSLGWALEMWGYAALGAATWLVAPAFGGTRLARLTGTLFVANGPLSIAAAIAAVLWPQWLLSVAGLVLYLLWNLLVVVMLLTAVGALRQRPVQPG